MYFIPTWIWWPGVIVPIKEQPYCQPAIFYTRQQISLIPRYRRQIDTDYTAGNRKEP